MFTAQPLAILCFKIYFMQMSFLAFRFILGAKNIQMIPIYTVIFNFKWRIYAVFYFISIDVYYTYQFYYQTVIVHSTNIFCHNIYKTITLLNFFSEQVIWLYIYRFSKCFRVVRHSSRIEFTLLIYTTCILPVNNTIGNFILSYCTILHNYYFYLSDHLAFITNNGRHIDSNFIAL